MFGRAWSMYVYLRGMQLIPRMRDNGFSKQQIQDILDRRGVLTRNDQYTQDLRAELASLINHNHPRVTRRRLLPRLIGDFGASLRHHAQGVPNIIAPAGPHGQCTFQNAVPG